MRCLLLLTVLLTCLFVPLWIEGGLVGVAEGGNASMTATPYLLGPPTNFTLEREDYSVVLNWTTAAGANTTHIRRSTQESPSSASDGVLVCNTSGDSWVDEDLSLDDVTYYYSAWSYNAARGGYSTEYATEDIGGGGPMLFIGFILLGLGMTWFSFRRPNILISFAAGLTWFAIALWLLLGDVSGLGMGSQWSQILAWVFVLMTFVPFVSQMNVEIRREARGRQWTEYGQRPEDEKESGYDRHKRELNRRLRGR